MTHGGLIRHEHHLAAQRAEQKEKNHCNLLLMFTKLNIFQPVIRAIIYDYQYDDPDVSNCLVTKKVEQLVAFICRPGGTKDGARNPRINSSLCVQEIISGAYFAPKDQMHWGIHPFYSLIISCSMTESLCLQQEIEEAHDISVALKNCPEWDSTRRAASADLIKDHFHQIQGVNGVPCTSYLMQEDTISNVKVFREKEPSHNLQLIKDYLIVVKTNPVNCNLWAGGKPPVLMLTPDAKEII